VALARVFSLHVNETCGMREFLTLRNLTTFAIYYMSREGPD
jgi:hypothetical protein